MDTQITQKKNKEKEDPYDFQPDIKISICSTDLNDVEQSLRRQQKNSKILNKIIQELNQKIVDLLKQTYEQQIDQAFSRILKIFEVLKKLQANFIFYDLYFTAFQSYADPKISTLSAQAKQNWQNIPAICLEKYITVFKIQNQIDPKDVESYINYLMLMKKVPEAIKIFNIFNMRKYMNMFDLLERVISQDKVSDAILLVEKTEVELQKHLILILTEKSYIDKCVDLIQQYGLNYKEFPLLISKMEKKHIEKVLPSPDDWEKAEERVHTNKEVLCYLVETLKEQGKKDEAASIVQRHQLEQLDYYKENIQKINSSGKYIPNRILEKDGFGPSEEVIFGQDQGTYIHLSQYDIQEEDVVFIYDTNEQKQIFQEAQQTILNSKIVGFDSEFASQWNKFEKGGVSIIQFAVQNKIYIFDALNLLGTKFSQEFFNFCKTLFESQQIIKAGHSISTDLNEMEKTFKSKKKFDLNNFVDIALLNRDIFSLANTASLKFMVQKLLNLQMSKFEQISNWDRRPLRKSQLHYAAVDAFIVVKLYEKLVQIQQAGGALKYVNVYQEEQKENLNNQDQKIKQNLTLVIDDKFTYTKENEHFFKKKNTTEIKFLIDNMLFKLVKYLRNSGIDAAYITEKDYQLLQDLSLREERVVVTRDNKLFNMKKSIPVYILQENLDTEKQFQEIIKFFKINQNKLNLLSRCVKCNNEKLVIISGEVAMQHLKFTHPQDFNKFEYWQCTQCKQVYWEGDTYKKSQKRFEDLNKKCNKK
ncbi:hypothetical protein ABPG74_001820 [Tetrahymena malaccensis]